MVVEDQQLVAVLMLLSAVVVVLLLFVADEKGTMYAMHDQRGSVELTEKREETEDNKCERGAIMIHHNIKEEHKRTKGKE